MNIAIRPWGNSHGIRIPKSVMEKLDIHENDVLEATVSNDALILKKAAKPTHKTVAERLEAFYGKPLDKITPVTEQEEIDTGDAVGEEIW